MSTPIFLIGQRHKKRGSKESLPSAYSGYYYFLKHPVRGEFERYLGRLQDGGIIEVKMYTLLGETHGVRFFEGESPVLVQ